MNEKNNEKWIENVERRGKGIIEEEYIDGGKEGDELMMMGMRMREGIEIES